MRSPDEPGGGRRSQEEPRAARRSQSAPKGETPGFLKLIEAKAKLKPEKSKQEDLYRIS